jgi:N-hydroxyarylamine O-acetyltransferase
MTQFDTASLDLDAYLARIGFDGRVTPDLATLETIAYRHPASIPFENLNPLSGRPVALDVESLVQKLVHGGRGGWCFEHNILLGTALAKIGFRVEGLAARVQWNVAAGVTTPRSHMVLHVDLDGRPYIVDAGFGGLTLTGPLRLEPGLEQETPHERFRLTPVDGAFVVEAELHGEWRALYRFDLQRQALADYQVTNWYLSNHPQSRFVTSLIAARVEADRRYGLSNTDLSIHHRDGFTERRTLTTGTEMRTTLEELFGIRVPTGADIDNALGRIAAFGTMPLTT